MDYGQYVKVALTGKVLFNSSFRVIATSQMQTDGARQTFPCFDEPSFKAKFTISLLSDTSLGYFGLSNMPDVAWEVSFELCVESGLS